MPRKKIFTSFCVYLSTIYDIRTAGPAPRGEFRGRAPPNDCLCPPKRRLCPEEINRLGAIGVQIEAGDSQIGEYRSYFRNFCGHTPNFIKLLGRRPFCFGLHLRNRKKSLEF